MSSNLLCHRKMQLLMCLPASFFRIVAPAKQHRGVTVAPGSGRKLSRKEFAVTFHSHTSTNDQIRVCGSSSRTSIGVNGIHVFSAAELDLAKLEVEAMQWKSAPALGFGISEFALVPQSDLWCMWNKLIELRAWSADNAYVVRTSDAEALRSLDGLCVYQMVECHSRLQSTSSWVITQSALAKIVAYQSVDKPVPIFFR